MSAKRALIARGERAPDFALPRDGGDGSVRFYGLVGGRPAVLVLAGDGETTVSALAERLVSSLGERADVHVVARTPVGGHPDAFQDADGSVHDAYGATGDEPVVVVLDANLRVVATEVAGDLQASVTAVAHAVPEPATDDGLAPRLAPVLFVPDALAVEFREELIERWSTGGSVETGVETIVEGERAETTDVRRKRRRDHTVTDQQTLRALTQHIGGRVFPELAKAFAFQAGGFEGFKIGCYAAEDRGHFEPHRDNLSAATAHRRFGLTVNLNDDYSGGDLRFPEYGATRYRPAAGEALVFSGTHLHEVLPVDRGRRFALLSFILTRR